MIQCASAAVAPPIDTIEPRVAPQPVRLRRSDVSDGLADRLTAYCAQLREEQRAAEGMRRRRRRR